jgi:hypothetical protein
MAYAIVLKNLYPKTMKVSLLDQQGGRKIAVPNRHNLAPGMVISYTTRSTQQMLFAQGVELVDQPSMTSFDELVFVHHVLELTHYFAPLEQPITGLYELLGLLYRKPYVFAATAYKKIFLAHLFILFGMWPRDKKLQLFFSQSFVLKPLDIADSNNVQLIHEQALNAWLRECVTLHPVSEQFKALDFWKGEIV